MKTQKLAKQLIALDPAARARLHQALCETARAIDPAHRCVGCGAPLNDKLAAALDGVAAAFATAADHAEFAADQVRIIPQQR
jgi:cytochrome c551/c552